MNEDILINITPQETRVALILQGAVQELHIERTLTRGLAGNVYSGKVVRVLPGMQSAFIDIGLERAAFLHVADIWEARGHDGQNATPAPIEKILFDGQVLTVQVIKDPIGTKGARLSTQISIAGRMLVYLPQDKHIGISQKIEKEAEREQLRVRLQSLLPPDEKGGYIVRTMAEDASDADLKADVDYLRKTWSTITHGARTRPATSLLHQDLSLAQRVLRDFVGDETATIQVDSRENYVKLREFAEIYTPSELTRLQHYTGERPLFDLYGVEEEILRALGRRVDLKSGGYLIVDQTEAMTTIDVNTGGFVGGRNFADTIFKTNLEAAHAIARQLRLRNLGGIIILDFIDMDNAEHRNAVLAELKRTLSRDRTKVSVSNFSPLGLVEMTRKRTRESLAHILCEPCPACAGKGQVKTSRTICYEILRELLREAKQFNPREFRILASQEVVDLFLEEESQHLAMLGDFIGKKISLQVENAYHQEQYDVIFDVAMPGDTAFWRDPLLPHVESRRACRSRACYKPHSHPTYSIGAVDAGGSVFTGSHGRQHPLSPGNLVLVPAGCVHACNPLPGAHWSYQMLHLDAHWLQGQVPQLRTDSATVLHAPALYAQFCSMNALLFSDAPAADKQAALLAFLHACASAGGAGTLPSAAARIPAQLQPVLQALQAQPLASLERLSNLAGMSRFQLIRTFRAATGMTPHAYQLNLGVNRARDGLQAGSALADIACELGFADQSHLQRVFKAHAGITPGRYRR